MGRKKRTAGDAFTGSGGDGGGDGAASTASTGAAVRTQESGRSSRNDNDDETYLVKKYRPDKYYRAIEAFQKYTKIHRMLDASYARFARGGATLEKPHVFSARVGGSDLAWGRGKTRDAAIDAACRAAFYLVQAHGYDDFDFDDDCLTEMPSQANKLVALPQIIPPPPPPPLPAGPPPTGMPPPGTAPFVPPPGAPPSSGYAYGSAGVLPPPVQSGNLPAPTGKVIPQGSQPSTEVPTASNLSAPGSGSAGVSLSIGGGEKKNSGAEGGADQTEKGPNLVYKGAVDEATGEELSMEEVRAKLVRYQKLMYRASVAAAAAATGTSVSPAIGFPPPTSFPPPPMGSHMMHLPPPGIGMPPPPFIHGMHHLPPPGSMPPMGFPPPPGAYPYQMPPPGAYMSHPPPFHRPPGGMSSLQLPPPGVSGGQGFSQPPPHYSAPSY